MKTAHNLIQLSLLAGLAVLAACSPDKDPIPDDNELITTVKLSFRQGSDSATTAIWQDKDGLGGKAPKIDTIKLRRGLTYNMAVSVLDESKTTARDMTADIFSKAEEHLLIYTAAPVGLLSVKIIDKDEKGLPLGLKAETTGSYVINNSATKADTVWRGTLKVQLRHQPGTKNGSAVFGSDDVNVDFPVWIRK